MKTGINRIDPRKYLDTWIWLDAWSWDGYQEIPPLLYESVVDGRVEPRFWRVQILPIPVREGTRERLAICFDKNVMGHDCDGHLEYGFGYYLRIDRFRFYEGLKEVKIEFVKGLYKGKTAEIVSENKGYYALKFEEDVGGCSLDGRYKKGTCLLLSKSMVRKQTKSEE